MKSRMSPRLLQWPVSGTDSELATRTSTRGVMHTGRQPYLLLVIGTSTPMISSGHLTMVISSVRVAEMPFATNPLETKVGVTIRKREKNQTMTGCRWWVDSSDLATIVCTLLGRETWDGVLKLERVVHMATRKGGRSKKL